MYGNMAPRTDTIFALSTAVGTAAISIVRVSGLNCIEILSKICPGVSFEPKRPKLVRLIDKDGIVFDRAIILFNKSPHSYTGEDLIEFHITGAKSVLACLVDVLSQCQGVRPAEPGEFSRRAYENGKMDLVEIEGLASVLSSETTAQLRHANNLAAGHLSRECRFVMDMLKEAIIQIESLLDFSDTEDSGLIHIENVKSVIEDATSRLEKLIGRVGAIDRLQEGMFVVLAGPPNVGKSTLLNAFAMKDLAIVSPIPGTTRDSLETRAEIGGFPVTVVDTAGMRETPDFLEAEGVRRAHDRVKRADLVLWLFDENSPDRPPFEVSSRVLRVRTKCDASDEITVDPDVIVISAITGYGMDELFRRIGACAERIFDGIGDVVLANERQRNAAQGALNALRVILAEPEMGLEIIAEELRAACHALGRIVGAFEVEDVLAGIFSRLCVGK